MTDEDRIDRLEAQVTAISQQIWATVQLLHSALDAVARGICEGDDPAVTSALTAGSAALASQNSRTIDDEHLVENLAQALHDYWSDAEGRVVPWWDDASESSKDNAREVAREWLKQMRGGT